MFNFSKLSAKSRSFVTHLSNMGRSRSLPASIALARVLVWDRTLPSGPVDNPVLFYKGQVSHEINDMICGINELVVLDIQAVQDFCESFWLTRYNACHPASCLLALNEQTSVEDFFGISRTVSPAIMTAIRTDFIGISTLANSFTELVECLRDCNAKADMEPPLVIGG